VAELKRSPTSVDWLLACGSAFAVLHSFELAYLALVKNSRPSVAALWGLGAMLQFILALVVIFLAQRHWRRHRTVPLSQLLQSWPKVIRALSWALFALCVLILVATALTYHLSPELSIGQPVARGGGYFLNVHGTYKAISLREYREAQRAGEQTFVSVSLIFYLVSLAWVGIAERRAKWNRERVSVVRE
jgi:hypothetical protein